MPVPPVRAAVPRRPRRLDRPGRRLRTALVGLSALATAAALAGAVPDAPRGPGAAGPPMAPGTPGTPGASGAPARPGPDATGPDATSSRFLVRYADPATAPARARAAGRGLGLEVSAARTLGTGATLVQPGRPLSAAEAQQLLDALAADPEVDYAEPDVLLQPYATPPDPRLREQWHYFEAAAGMSLPPAWDSADGAGVVVAVVDTGMTAHAELARLVPGYDFVSEAAMARDGGGRDSDPADPGDWTAVGDCGSTTARNSSWHGTHVAGTVTGAWGNARGGAGVARLAKVQPVRVLGKCGGYLSDIVDGLVWAAGGSVPGVPANRTPAKVVNLSLGGAGSCSRAYQAAIDAAVGRGSSVVVAAGNSSTDAAAHQPASCANVVVVAAADRQGNRAQYSNYGAAVDVTAPGGETGVRSDGVLSTYNAGTTAPGAESYGFLQGTSMAAPHVAGLAALLLGEKAMTPAQVETALKTSARPLPGSCTGGCGAGLVDAARTVRAVTGATSTSTYVNPTDRPIPDLGSAESSVSVARAGSAPVNLLVAVEIAHPYRGDLALDLIAPDGTAYRLKGSAESDGAADVRTTYAVNASAEAAAGTWRLRMRDVYADLTGTLERWSLQF